MAALEIEDPIHLVGLSMGGPIVTRYANKHPELVKSITFIAPEIIQVTRQQIFPMNLPGVGEYIMAVVMERSSYPGCSRATFSTLRYTLSGKICIGFSFNTMEPEEHCFPQSGIL